MMRADKPAEKTATPSKPVVFPQAAKPAPAPPVDHFAAARRAEHERRGRLEEAGEAILAFLAVPNEDGSGKTLDAIRGAVSLSEADFSLVLGELDSQGFVERSTSRETTLVWHLRQTSRAQRIIIP